MAEGEEAGLTETDATEDEEENDEVLANEGEVDEIVANEGEGDEIMANNEGEGDEMMTEEGETDEFMTEDEGLTDENEDQTQAISKENEKLLKESEKRESRAAKPPESEVLKGKIDEKTMEQLQKYEKEAKETANQIHDTKTKVEDLLTIEKMTKEQEKELEEKSLELGELMSKFDQITQKIQEIIANTNILESMQSRIPQEKHEEDILPRVILCGLEDEYVPKLVVCHQKNKGGAGSPQECAPKCPGNSPPPCVPSQPSCTKRQPSCTKRQPSCTKRQPSCTKRPDSTEEIEKIKSQLEKDITDKNRMLEQLQINLGSLQNEIHRVAVENAQLNERIRKMQQEQKKKSQQCSQPQKICPTVLAAKLKEYGNYTRKLERTVADMEEDFERVHKEIRDAIKARDFMSKKNCMRPPCSRR